MTEKGSSDENTILTGKQVKALDALLRGGTVGNAAKLADISQRQLYRWLSDPAFKNALADAQRERMVSTVRALSDAGSNAVLVLRQIMNDPKARRDDGVRVRAAIGLLTVALRWAELLEIEQRVSALEAAQRNKAR